VYDTETIFTAVAIPFVTFIEHGTLYIQDETFTTNTNIDANKIIIGRDLWHFQITK